MAAEIVALCRAGQLQAVPHAVSISHATVFVSFVLVDALAAARCRCPLAFRVRRHARVNTLQVAGLGALAGARVPEARAVAIAVNLSGVAIEALVVATCKLRRVPLAVRVGRAERWVPVVDTLHAAELAGRVEAAHAVGIAELRASLFVAASSACSGCEIKHAARIRSASRHVRRQERAVHAALVVQPRAHGLLTTCKARRDCGTRRLALLHRRVVHTHWIVVTRVAVCWKWVLGSALVLARIRCVVPQAHAVGVTHGNVMLGSVRSTVVSAYSADNIPCAARICSARCLIRIEIQALAVARQRCNVPLAHAGLEADGLVQKVAEPRASREHWVPHAVRLANAQGLGRLTILACLGAEWSAVRVRVPQAHGNIRAHADDRVRGAVRVLRSIVHGAVWTAC